MGQERYDKLTAAGYDGDAVQRKVNELLKPTVDFSGHKNKIELTEDLIILDALKGQRRGLANKGTVIKFDEVYIDGGLFIAYLNGRGERCFIQIADIKDGKVKGIRGNVSRA